MAIVSRIIKATLDAELIKLSDENVALKIEDIYHTGHKFYLMGI